MESSLVFKDSVDVSQRVATGESFLNFRESHQKLRPDGWCLLSFGKLGKEVVHGGVCVCFGKW